MTSFIELICLCFLVETTNLPTIIHNINKIRECVRVHVKSTLTDQGPCSRDPGP